MKALTTVAFLYMCSGITGCATPAGRVAAWNYYNWAMQAVDARDYELAREFYKDALLHGKQSGLPASFISMVIDDLDRIRRKEYMQGR